MGRNPWHWPGCKSTEGANSHHISGRVPANVEKSLWQGARRMNLVVGHHEGEWGWDTKICQKADEEWDHDAQGDGPLGISGFFPCRIGGSTGSGNTPGWKHKFPFPVEPPKKPPTPKRSPVRAHTLDGTMTTLPVVAMTSKPTNA